MQSNKPSKKTRKNASETITAVPEISPASELTAKPRTARSSKTKKNEPAETGTVKHHHKIASPVVAEPPVVEVELLAKAAAAGAEAPPAAAGVIADTRPASVRWATSEEVAKLAHSYWLARGCAHGHAEEDWLRAERELNGR